MCIFLCDAWYACLLSCYCFHFHNCYHLYFKIQFLFFLSLSVGKSGDVFSNDHFRWYHFQCMLIGWLSTVSCEGAESDCPRMRLLLEVYMHGGQSFAWPHWFSTKQTWGKQAVQCSLFWIHWCTTKYDANALFEMLHWQPGYLFFSARDSSSLLLVAGALFLIYFILLNVITNSLAPLLWCTTVQIGW